MTSAVHVFLCCPFRSNTIAFIETPGFPPEFIINLQMPDFQHLLLLFLLPVQFPQ